MRSILNLSKKVDMFGKPFIFEEKDNQKFTTLVGTILTFFIIITCCVIGFLFGKEIYERKSPSVLSSEEIIEVSRVNMTDFPIFFTFKTGDGKYQPLDTKHFRMEISTLTFSKDFKIKSRFYEGYKKCDISEYSEKYHPKIKEIYDDMWDTNELYCTNRNDLYVQNRYAAVNSALINVRFRLCDEERDKNCVDVEEGKKIINDLYIYYVYVDSYVDSSSYKNPVTYFAAAKSQKVSLSFLQINYFSIQQTKLITHKGWLLEDIHEEEHYSMQSIVKEVTETYKGNAFWLAIDSPNLRPKITRSYTKLQDIIAKIGGFFNGLYVCTLILTKNFIDFSFYSYIYNYFIEICSESNKEIKVSNNNDLSISNNNNTINKLFIKHPLSKVKSEIFDKSYRTSNPNAQSDQISKLSPEKNVKFNNQSNILSKNILKHSINNDSSNINISRNQFLNNYVKSPQRTNDNDNQILNKNNIIETTNKIIADKEASSKMPKVDLKDKQPSSYFDLKLDKSSSDLNRSSSDKMNYFMYLIHDVLCCRNKFALHMKAVSKIISFENLLEVNYEYIIKNNILSS